MGEAKRRAQVAAASITEEHRCIASRIDERMMLLDAAGLDEVEIIAAMTDYMSDFHRLITEMTAPAMNALCSEFAGLYRYAKIVETIASGIASGQIKVPGGRAHSEEHRIAAAIDQRVRQLEAKGVSDEALPEHMVGSHRGLRAQRRVGRYRRRPAPRRWQRGCHGEAGGSH
jgi:hypothetical protein